MEFAVHERSAQLDRRTLRAAGFIIQKTMTARHVAQTKY